MKKLIALLAVAVIGFTAHCQTGLVPVFMGNNGCNSYIPQDNVVDTIIKSTTNFWYCEANFFTQNTNVSYSFWVDSTGGSPACTLSLWTSNDKVHWMNTGTNVVITTHSTWYKTSTVPNKSDTTVTVNVTPLPGRYYGFKIVWTSATQRGRYGVYVKSKCN